MRPERKIIAGFLLAGFLLASPPIPAISQTSVINQPVSAPGIDPDPLVQAMIDQVDPQAIYNLTGDLSGEWPVTSLIKPIH
jgi:hypothetical protein